MNSIPPLPPSGERFRKVIEMIKRRILEENLTEPGKQNISNFKSAGARIQHLANVLNNLVDKKEDYNETTSDIRIIFKNHGIDFLNLTDEEHDLFKYYIDRDIIQTPYKLGS